MILRREDRHDVDGRPSDSFDPRKTACLVGSRLQHFTHAGFVRLAEEMSNGLDMMEIEECAQLCTLSIRHNSMLLFAISSGKGGSSVIFTQLISMHLHGFAISWHARKMLQIEAGYQGGAEYPKAERKTFSAPCALFINYVAVRLQ